MSSRTLTNIITPQTKALNAQIFGFSGHSLVTPQTHIEQLWWTESWINAKVNRQFVISKLLADERDQLYKPLAFGDGLTDDTYLDWILQRARRLFLTLAETGVPDQIFGIIDDSWDDDDLPIPFNMVSRLALSYRPDEALDRRFYDIQFKYLLRELKEGAHIDYAPMEAVPLEIVHELPPAVLLQSWYRVHLPKQPDQTFMRRRISINNEKSGRPGSARRDEEEFISDVETMKTIDNDHVAPIYASYTSKGCGYLLTPFIGYHTLKTFIEHRTAPQYMELSKPHRQELLLRWMHCLAECVAKLHRNGFSHTAIMPSNILINAQNDIAFSEIGCLRSLQKDKKIDDSELYDYAAPEAHPHPVTLIGPSSQSSKIRIGSTSSSSSRVKSYASSTASSTSSARSAIGRRDSSARSSVPPPNLFIKTTCANDIDSRQHHDFDPPPLSPVSPSIVVSETSDTSLPQQYLKEKSDIFSLGCVFVDILTFLLKKKTSEATKHRQSKVKLHGRGGSRINTSYHVNLDKAFSWCDVLGKTAHDLDSQVFRGIPSLLQLIRMMLTRDPEARPTADEVSALMSDILTMRCRIPHLHCGSGRAPAAISDENKAVPMRPIISTAPTQDTSVATKEKKEYLRKEKSEEKHKKELEIRQRTQQVTHNDKKWQHGMMMTWAS